MILVDTSVWISHLRAGERALARALENHEVLAHPFITGELALGNLGQRTLVLDALQALPQALVATDREVLRFIGECALHGRGIGYVDAHLLAASRLTPDASLWTFDKRLRRAAEALGVATVLPIG